MSAVTAIVHTLELPAWPGGALAPGRATDRLTTFRVWFRFLPVLREEVPSLAERERRLLVAALCHLDSSATWVTMRRELGMDGWNIADAAMWAAEAQLGQIRDRTAG